MLRLSGAPHFAHWLIAMTVATALAGIAYTVRLRTLRRLVGLRHDLERRVEERTQAVSQANATLAAEIVSRREAEVEVREVAELLMLVVESLPACIAYLDQDERHSLVNEKYAECFRRIKADFKGTGLREMVGEAFYVAVEPSVRQVFLGEQPRVEIRWSGNDGTPRIYDLRLTPHLGEDRRVNGFFLLAIDVTEQKRQEEAFIAAQRSESLGVMAGGIAHDFNNLLTGILGNAGLIKLDLPPGCNAYVGLEHVEIAAQRAAELCSQMLAYSGRGRFVVQALNVNEIISEMTHLMRFSISKFAILKQELASEPPWVMADATQMRQVIMNLVINASEAIGETPGVIDIATRLLRAKRSELKELHLSPDLPEGEYVNLEVRDTGCGMTPEVLARIFDPFYTTKFTGRGLGLAAVLGIIRGHQGGIRMESHPGRGSTFHIYLPAVSADPLEASVPRLNRPNGARRARSYWWTMRKWFGNLPVAF